MFCFRSVRDPKSLTARQKALLNDGVESEELYQSLDYGRTEYIELKLLNYPLKVSCWII